VPSRGPRDPAVMRSEGIPIQHVDDLTAALEAGSAPPPGTLGIGAVLAAVGRWSGRRSFSGQLLPPSATWSKWLADRFLASAVQGAARSGPTCSRPGAGAIWWGNLRGGPWRGRQMAHLGARRLRRGSDRLAAVLTPFCRRFELGPNILVLISGEKHAGGGLLDPCLFHSSSVSVSSGLARRHRRRHPRSLQHVLAADRTRRIWVARKNCRRPFRRLGVRCAGWEWAAGAGIGAIIGRVFRAGRRAASASWIINRPCKGIFPRSYFLWLRTGLAGGLPRRLDDYGPRLWESRGRRGARLTARFWLMGGFLVRVRRGLLGNLLAAVAWELGVAGERAQCHRPGRTPTDVLRGPRWAHPGILSSEVASLGRAALRTLVPVWTSARFSAIAAWFSPIASGMRNPLTVVFSSRACGGR